MQVSDIVTGSILLAFAVFIPGFALTLAVFPKKDSITYVERAGFSLIFGLIPHLTIYFLTKNLSVAITSTSSIGVLASYTLLGYYLYRRRG